MKLTITDYISVVSLGKSERSACTYCTSVLVLRHLMQRTRIEPDVYII